MKKRLLTGLCASALITMTACSTSTNANVTLTGKGKGFGGEVTVTVTKKGDKIIEVKAVGEKETPNVAGKALEQIPKAIVAANSAEVDVVSGATVTSKAIIYAVNNALDPQKYPAPEEKKTDNGPGSVTAAKVFQGFGLSNIARVGPGKDDKDTQVYSVNQVFANVLFDENGKILTLYVDQLEVATPNYDGDGMPHFSGFPGQGGYNYDKDHDGKVDGKTSDTQDNFKAEINGWVTKRGRGEKYVMSEIGTWSDQMNRFQKLFVGKTVKEVEDWFKKYTSDLNGRPLKANSSKDEDKKKYEALSADEKAMLAEVTSGATMSLNDSHGNIIQAIKSAYENRVGIDIKSAASQGFGLVNTPRVGPGKDNKDVQVYSINQVFANTLFDKDGKILSLYVDQLEVATPNYDGDGMPHFSGFPGQGGYNYDKDHDEKIDSKTPDTQDNFKAEIEGWVTKRGRGDKYVMSEIGTWSKQMDAFQKLFVGKTVKEVEDWFKKYTSDLNGRPLKANSSKEEDKKKYDALSADEKAMLAEVTSGATMSLNDSHGNIIEAIKKSFEGRVNVDLTVK